MKPHSQLHVTEVTECIAVKVATRLTHVTSNTDSLMAWGSSCLPFPYLYILAAFHPYIQKSFYLVFSTLFYTPFNLLSLALCLTSVSLFSFVSIDLDQRIFSLHKEAMAEMQCFLVMIQEVFKWLGMCPVQGLKFFV